MHKRIFTIKRDLNLLKQKMETAIENLKVPSSVDVAMGKSWGEAKE